MKLFSLSKRFYECKNFELDDPDIKLVRGIVEGSKTYMVIAIAQMIDVLDSAKTKN